VCVCVCVLADVAHVVQRGSIVIWDAPLGSTHVSHRGSIGITSCDAHTCRVGQNHIYTVYIRYFWQVNHQIYGHIRCVYTVMANPTHVLQMGSIGMLVRYC